MAVLDKEALISLYRKRAGFYDISANLYYLIGFRELAYRKKAVEALGLRPGDRVVEIGCGTGLNFPLLQRHIGPEGRITGVDLSGEMLAKARKRIRVNRWTNVVLVEHDAAKYRFPERVEGVLSTFALTLVPEYDEVVRNGAATLSPGGRFVILDFKMPSTRISVFAPLLAYITVPFGVSMELAERHPWESVDRYLEGVSLREYYGGFVYIASGERK